MQNKGKLGSTLLLIITKPLSWLPLPFHRAAARFAGWLVGSVFRYRRDVVMTNLSRSFPDKKYKELCGICKRFYYHFAKVFTEAIWYGSCTNTERLRKSHIVTFSNPEVLRHIHSLGRSVIIACSHCGNWELYGGFEHYTHEDTGYKEDDLAMAYRRMRSHVWNRFMNNNRKAPLRNRKTHDGLVESFEIMRFAFRNRHNNRLYFFVSDQYPYGKSSRFTLEFMHQSTQVMDGAAQLARTMGMAFAYLNMKENEDGNYTMHMTLISEDSSKEDSHELMRRYYALVEKDLEEQPWNYLWTHKRWK